MKYLFQLLFYLIAVSFCSPVWAELKGFQSAVLMEPSIPVYPVDVRSDSGGNLSRDSGVVELIYMVDENGFPTEVLVVNSSHSKFNQAAKNAISEYRYKPARLNLKAVRSVVSTTVRFKFSAVDLRDSRGVKSINIAEDRYRNMPNGFSTFYQRVNIELEKTNPNARRVAHTISKMEGIKHHTFFSLAYLSIARLNYARKLGTEHEQVKAISELIRFDSFIADQYKILTGETKTTYLAALLKLQIEAGMFAEALNNYADFKQQNPQIEKMFKPTMVKLEYLRDSQSLVERAIKIGEQGFVQLPLLKRVFLIDQIDGKIDSLKLRCDTRFLKILYKPDSQYDVPDKWGNCNLQIAGAVGTKAILIQQ